MDPLAYFVLGVVVYQLFKAGYLVLNQYMKERREKRLLKMVQVAFPGNEKITFIAIDGNDKHAMAKLEREVRSHYEVEDDIGDIAFDNPYPQDKTKS